MIAQKCEQGRGLFFGCPFLSVLVLNPPEKGEWFVLFPLLQILLYIHDRVARLEKHVRTNLRRRSLPIFAKKKEMLEKSQIG